jgi:hypothetical protein
MGTGEIGSLLLNRIGIAESIEHNGATLRCERCGNAHADAAAGTSHDCNMIMKHGCDPPST